MKWFFTLVRQNEKQKAISFPWFLHMYQWTVDLTFSTLFFSLKSGDGTCKKRELRAWNERSNVLYKSQDNVEVGMQLFTICAHNLSLGLLTHEVYMKCVSACIPAPHLRWYEDGPWVCRGMKGERWEKRRKCSRNHTPHRSQSFKKTVNTQSKAHKEKVFWDKASHLSGKSTKLSTEKSIWYSTGMTTAS